MAFLFVLPCRKSNFTSYFVGTARADHAKVTIKEHHTTNYSENDAADEIELLVKLSHDSIPKVSEIFITNISMFTVSSLRLQTSLRSL